MKSAPSVPGDTPWERLDSAVRTIFTVPKDALLKEEKRQKKMRQKKREKKQSRSAGATLESRERS